MTDKKSFYHYWITDLVAKDIKEKFLKDLPDTKQIDVLNMMLSNKELNYHLNSSNSFYASIYRDAIKRIMTSLKDYLDVCNKFENLEIDFEKVVLTCAAQALFDERIKIDPLYKGNSRLTIEQTLKDVENDLIAKYGSPDNINKYDQIRAECLKFLLEEGISILDIQEPEPNEDEEIVSYSIPSRHKMYVIRSVANSILMNELSIYPDEMRKIKIKEIIENKEEWHDPADVFSAIRLEALKWLAIQQIL